MIPAALKTKNQAVIPLTPYEFPELIPEGTILVRKI